MKTWKYPKYILLFTTVSLVLSFAQTDITEVRINDLTNDLVKWVDTLHPQKIYLQLDKKSYYSHDKIWFKAYLLDGTNHKSDSASKHIYVELINPFKNIVQTVRIRMKEGEGDGVFTLIDTVPEGLYQIRAYTNWMKNFDPGYYFHTTLSVYNVYNKYLITKKEAKKNKKIIKTRKKKEEIYFTRFFPEGGRMLRGYETKVAFKSSNILGTGVAAEGIVKDQDKNVATRFKTMHNGMGYFYLKPENGKVYIAYVSYEGGKEIKTDLPEPVENGFGLKLGENAKYFFLNIFSNKEPSNDRPANEIIILGQTRGRIYFSSSVNLLDGEQLVQIPKERFPSGIVQFTLINNRLLPVAERLAFVNRNDFIDVSVRGARSGDSVHLYFSAPEMAQPELGLSASVLYGIDQSTLRSENIVSDLLLTSDLPGYIEDPNYYFQNSNDTVTKNLDLLMLVNGWKRFLWQDVIAQNYPKLDYSFEKGVTITGKITREMFEFPYRNAKVNLYIQNTYNDEFQAVSGRRGEFMFDNLNYPDTIDVKIVARKPYGGKNLLIHLDENNPEETPEFEGNYFLTTHSEMNMKEYRRKKNEQAKLAMNKKEHDLDSIFNQSIHGRPDNVLWGKDIPPGYSDLLSAMQGRIPGVNISGNKIIIRGINTLYGSTDPLVLVDDIPSDVSILSSIPTQDVDRVEILKGPSASMYGSRGGNGVIAVYTKRGNYMKHGEISFSMLGYQSKESFHPQNQIKLGKGADTGFSPLTLYWEPELKVERNRYSSMEFPVNKEIKKMVVIVEGTDYNGRLAYSIAVIDYSH